MNRACNNCGHHELAVVSRHVFRHAAIAISQFVNIEVEYVCPECRQQTMLKAVVDVGEADRIGLLQLQPGSPDEVKRHPAELFVNTADGRRSPLLQYKAVYRTNEDVLYPISEGNIQDGTFVDKHGDPDLLLDFAEQYFGLFRATMPTGRLPDRLPEFMPVLHLLIIATELSIKAYLLRKCKYNYGHSLQQLYDNLEPEHRAEINKRFSALDLNTNLVSLGVQPPTVKDILQMYDNTYGGESKAYMDTRYYAEPTTTTFKTSSSSHGAIIVKSNTLYPIFLPEIVVILLDVYRFFSGHERLRRLGGDVSHGDREPISENHGDWGLIPSSLGLVVLTVPQSAGISAKGDGLRAFNRLLSENAPAYRTDWMYGGRTHLFYADGGQEYNDGKGVLNGVECRVWREKRLGMHARDLNQLADTLESGSALGRLSGKLSVSEDSP